MLRKLLKTKTIINANGLRTGERTDVHANKCARIRKLKSAKTHSYTQTIVAFIHLLYLTNLTDE